MTKETGDRIRQLRHDRGLTIEELAHRAGLSRRRMIDIDNGKYIGRAATIMRIAAALNTTVAYLLGETEDRIKMTATDTANIDSGRPMRRV